MSNVGALEREVRSPESAWHFVDEARESPIEMDGVENAEESRTLRDRWFFSDRLSELIREIDESGQLDRAATLVARAWAERSLSKWGDLEAALAEGAAAYADEDLTIAEQTFRLGSEDLADE